MLLKIVYLLVRRILDLAVLVFRGDRANDAELLVLRHENAVLRRHVGRVRCEPADRVWFAALARLLSRGRWTAIFPVTPATRTLLDPKIAGQYCVDSQVRMSTTREHVILDLTSEDEAGEWVEDTEESLSAIVGVRSELAAGDLRPLYLAWLSGYGVWERDEDAFGEEDEDEMEPPVPAGLGSLTAAQRALADFLRLDSDLLDVAAETSAALPTVNGDARALARHIAKLPVSDKNRLLTLVAEDQAARARMELLRGFRADPHKQRDSRPRRTVAELLDTAGARRLQRGR